MGFHEIEPLIAFNDPAQVWKEQPTFLMYEVLSIVIFLLSCVHAGKHGRQHVQLLIASLTGGGMIELLTILEHDNVGNFYHSQAVVMLFGRREPFYMLIACYGWFQYASVALSWQVGLPWLPTACLSGLLCSFAWGILDIVGMKQLWWTWHRDEPLYADRIHGVPVASTFWILSTAWALSVTLSGLDKSFLRRSVVASLVVGPIASVVVMQVPFTFFYHPLVTFATFHASLALYAARLTCLVIVVKAAITHRVRVSLPTHGDSLLVSVAFQMGGLFAGFGSFLAWKHSDARAIRRQSFGQPFGTDCSETEQSFWGGFHRAKYVCQQSVDPARDMYSLDCWSDKDLPSVGDSWYTVCGTVSGPEWQAGVGLLVAALVVLVLFCEFVQVRRVGKGGKKKKSS